MLWDVELWSIDIDENKTGPKWKVPKEVKAARNREVKQTPERNPTTQIWQENELPICSALWETTLSIDFWFNASIVLWQLFQWSTNFKNHTIMRKKVGMSCDFDNWLCNWKVEKKSIIREHRNKHMQRKEQKFQSGKKIRIWHNTIQYNSFTRKKAFGTSTHIFYI